MTIQLKKLTRANWEECIHLRVAASQQGFVADNLFSLAEAKIDRSLVPLAIYDGGTMVGFLMYGRDPEEGRYWIVRLMVDEKYQGRGYGKAAMLQVIGKLKRKKDCYDISISHEPENAVADRLYVQLGFENTGEIIEGEGVKRLLLARRENTTARRK
jgi:diamine N-acetyltransferase